METRLSITNWARETFGPIHAIDVAVRMNHEMAELLTAINTDQDKEDILAECADIRIMLSQIEHLCGLGGNSNPHVDEKMAINRSRSWGTKNGKVQHL